MHSMTRFAAVTALVLLLHVTPSWGQTPTCSPPGCNPTESDANVNTAGGTGALANVASGAFGGAVNTAFGYNALFNTATANNNTAIGYRSLFSNTIGIYNTAIGSDALVNNTTGSLNTATGVDALVNNTTGWNNTGSGYSALANNMVGSKNTAIGRALVYTTGHKNIAIGFNSGIHLLSGNNNIYLGSQGVDSVELQTMGLGKGQETRTFIAGIATASVSDAAVMIDTMTGQLGIATSSARYKQDIVPMGTRSEKVLDLRPVASPTRTTPRGRRTTA